MNEKKTNGNILYLVILVMAVLLLVCFTKINSLSREIDNLRNDYLSEDDALRGEIHAIYENVDEQMKQQASLFTSTEFSIGDLDVGTETAPITIHVVPKEISNDMHMTVRVDGEVAEFTRDGSSFSATIPVGLFVDEYAYPVVTIKTEGVTKTEQLDDINLGGLWGKWLPQLYAEDTTGRTNFKEGILTFDTEIAIDCTGSGAGAEVTFEKFSLVTELNGTEIENRDITSEVVGSEDYDKGSVILKFTDSYEVAEGDKLSVYIVAEDTLGYVHKTLAHYWYRTGGATAESVYGGEQIFDREGNLIYGY